MEVLQTHAVLVYITPFALVVVERLSCCLDGFNKVVHNLERVYLIFRIEVPHKYLLGCQSFKSQDVTAE